LPFACPGLTLSVARKQSSTGLPSVVRQGRCVRPRLHLGQYHVSTDGTRVVNYAQWQSAEAYQSMLQDPSARGHMGVCADVATSFEPHLYTVESVHGRS
jgi:hypothetical protein